MNTQVVSAPTRRQSGQSLGQPSSATTRPGTGTSSTGVDVVTRAIDTVRPHPSHMASTLGKDQFDVEPFPSRTTFNEGHGVDSGDDDEQPVKTRGEACFQLSFALFIVIPLACALTAAFGAAIIYKVRP